MQEAFDFLDKRGVRKGTNGVSTNWVTAIYMFVDRGTFWVLPLTCFYLPKRARAYPFPQSVKFPYFCGDPIGVDPICPPPRRAPGVQPVQLLAPLPEAELAGHRKANNAIIKQTKPNKTTKQTVTHT